MKYKVLLKEEPEGGYTVLVPTLPGCITYGDNVEEALAHAKEAIEGYLEALLDMGEDIPQETSFIETNIEVIIDAKTTGLVT